MTRTNGRVILALGLGLLGLWSAQAFAAAISTTAVNPVQTVQLQIDGQQAMVALPTKDWEGKRWVELKNAVEKLGGATVWYLVTKKVVIKGPQGRQAVVTAGMPRMVVDRRHMVRLPQVPRILDGTMCVSMESLQVIWSQVCEQQAREETPGRNTRQEAAGTQRHQAVASKRATAPVRVQPRQHLLVVVDAGHGGKDPGAIGPTKLKEKTVTLEIARQLAYFLKKQGIKVVMTRSNDRYISLRKRADLANRLKADLFVSIHANASRNRRANGTQVFIYNREASSRHAAEAAQLENQDANYLEIIKDDLRQSVHELASVNAAGFVSQQMGKLGMDVKRIERAPFYVLAKSHMPSILVETAFISNYKEERELRSRGFCKKLARGIFDGVANYYRVAAGHQRQAMAEAKR